MHKLILFFALVFALNLIIQPNAAQQNDLDKIKSKFLPPELSNSNFTVEDAKEILKEKCRKASGENETAYIEAQNGVAEFMKCISGLANLTAMQEEIETAKPIGELDTVFSKYCGKRSQAELCVNNFNIKIQPCLNIEEKLHNDVLMRIATKLLEFICYKGGDQIALFIAEKGPECLEANKENINSCMNASFSGYIPKNGIPDVNNLPQLVIGKKECIDLQDFEECVLFYLEKCNDITPSNIIESMFKFVKNETKCQPKALEKSARSKGPTLFMNLFSLISGLTILLLIKYF